MKTLINLSLLGALTLGFAACGGGAMDDLSSWKDSACACKDTECATKQGKAFVALTKKYKDAEKPSKEDRKKMNKVANEGQACLETHGVDVYDMM
jgi:Tfp pilus assembly protein PilP